MTCGPKRDRWSVLNTGIFPAISLFAALVSAEVQAEGLAWKKLADMPVGKWEPGTVIIDRKLYLAGGSLNGYSVHAEVWVTHAP
ncbi:MAG: hypothetical protein QF715_08810 [Pseudomonadales bacterium]|jgi:hypothetical protein|nr:hypothetical protein [Gammaproteobacteria bacterium]MDP6026149.1 hypothetical protein [Pseudomonadales bacterium]MDP6314986.1 hypothetical protein [Pseudomonadales bacterium]MDP7314864.1 hypothetical protein [Pseudomonadales bacterium]MDP7451234.1 hypothetical protein [Arenicellales bacterium]